MATVDPPREEDVTQRPDTVNARVSVNADVEEHLFPWLRCGVSVFTLHNVREQTTFVPKRDLVYSSYCTA